MSFLNLHRSEQARRRRRAAGASTDEAGMTLIEMVLGVMISGFVLSALAMAIVVILRTDRPTSDRITEAKDVAFLQTYLPVDYSSAISRNVDPLHQPIAGETLPGTNVLSLVREEGDGGATTIITSYRYALVGEDWQLLRYEWGNPDNGGVLTRTVVAHQLAAPPAEWTADQTPAHAIVVSARNQTLVRPVGDDMQITFKSGNAFTTGGAGLASNSELPTDYSGSTSDPTVVRSRCGGRVTLILDVSGSIGWYPDGPSGVKSAATGFIDAFTGTPSELSIIKFREYAGTVSPASYGSYFSVLTPGSTAITTAKTAVNNLVIEGGTNWEDGLYRATRSDTGVVHSLLPELIVFITDGDPTHARTYPYWWNNWWTSDTDRYNWTTTQAANAANFARERDGRTIGILVGDAATRPASVARLKQVVGSTVWNGTSGTDVGNAATADFFIPPGGDFSKLGGVLKAVVAGECGGTVTIQKKIEVGGVLNEPTQPWSYTTDVGVRELHPSTDTAITVDFTFETGQATKAVQIVEQPNAGYQLNRVECTSNGVALGNDRVSDAPDQASGVDIEIRPNEAVSCTFISRPE